MASPASRHCALSILTLLLKRSPKHPSPSNAVFILLQQLLLELKNYGERFSLYL